MKVRVKYFNELAKGKLPFKKHDSDFCYDVYATSKEEKAPGVIRYGLGIGFQIVPEESLEMFYEKITDRPSMEEVEFSAILLPWKDEQIRLSIDLRPRSSVWETGLILSNCEATVDFGYENEVAAVFYQVKEGPMFKPYEVGDRIGQIKLGFTLKMDFVDDEEFEHRDRGMGGFGSTGRK